MIKVNVLYGPPTDPAAFEEYYRTIHAPIASKLPNLQTFEYGKVVGTADGSESPYFWIASLTFPSPEAMGAAMTSPEGQAAGDDVPKFATGGVSVIMSEC
jgi:uncharacterized protein (TIGR02118 family)